LRDSSTADPTADVHSTVDELTYKRDVQSQPSYFL
jgi:hypothetical protein